MVRSLAEEPCVIPTRPMSRFALFGLLTAALALGACGRKGGLDAPPGGSAAIGQADKDTGRSTLTGQPQQSSQSGNVVGRSKTGLPRIRGEDKRIPLDVLLN
jgi:predicted small lipoprotein YifL